MNKIQVTDGKVDLFLGMNAFHPLHRMQLMHRLHLSWKVFFMWLILHSNVEESNAQRVMTC